MGILKGRSLRSEEFRQSSNQAGLGLDCLVIGRAMKHTQLELVICYIDYEIQNVGKHTLFING
jgi:hypothetical protein